MTTLSVLDNLDNLMRNKKRSANVNDTLEQTLEDLKHLQLLTGDKYFDEQVQALASYIKQLPEEQCSKWNLNKKKFEVKPVPIPTENLYGILELHKKNGDDQSQLFSPLYSIRVFTDLEQAKEAEAANIKQWKLLHDNWIQNSSADDVFYHPALYKLSFAGC